METYSSIAKMCFSAGSTESKYKIGCDLLKMYANQKLNQTLEHWGRTWPLFTLTKVCIKIIINIYIRTYVLKQQPLTQLLQNTIYMGVHLFL